MEKENARLKAAVFGNCVLRNREGLERPMEIDSVLLHGQDHFSGYRPPLRHIKLRERRENPDYFSQSACFGTAVHSAIREVTYYNTGNTDAFGRVLLEEI